MKQRLNVAVAFLHQPMVLLLDEPTVALDPASREILFQLLGEWCDPGRTVILATHHLDEAEQWCDRVGVLREGRLTEIGPPSRVLHAADQGIWLQGVLDEEISEATESSLRIRLPANTSLLVDGRRIRLHAADLQQLGRVLLVLSNANIHLDSFRTTPARLDPSGEFIDDDAGPSILAFREAA